MNRKRLGIASGAVVAVTATVALAVMSRRHSQFDFLYSLDPAVGVLPSSGRPPLGSSILTFSVARGPISTSAIFPPAGRLLNDRPVLIFPSSQRRVVEEYVSKKLYGAKLSFVLPSAAYYTSRFGGSRRSVMPLPPADQTFYQAIDGKSWAELDTGLAAQRTATASHMALPADGFVVVLGEEPNWLTTKLGAIMSFLHLR